MLLRGVRLSDLEDDRDLDIETDSRRDRRDLGGGEGLKDGDVVDLLRFDGRGEREWEDEGFGDLRRVPRSGLLPRPRPPLPLYVVLRRSGDLDLRLRGAGERDLEVGRSLRRDGERDPDSDRTGVGDIDSGVDDLLRSSRLRPPRPPGTYVSDSRGKGARKDRKSTRLNSSHERRSRMPSSA